MSAEKILPMTSQNQSEQDILQQFVTAFRKAETAVKKAENSVQFRPCETGRSFDVRGPFLPAINELRYAACHIADYLENRDAISIQKAVSHCQRAEYDAYDCQIHFFLSECRQFQDDYRTVVISSVIPDYIDITQKLSDISLNPTTREQATEQIINDKQRDTEELVSIYRRFQASRDELNKLVGQKVREGVRERESFRETIIAAIVGAVAGAVATFIISFFWR